MTGINFTTRQNDRTNLYYIKFNYTLLQVKLTGINFTTSQIQESPLTGINFTTSQIEWNKFYNKSK